MAVYVDDMRARFGRMKMCHMIADSSEELHAMAERIGVARKWCQDEGVPHREHYDIALSKRALAVKAGAVEVTQRQLAMKLRERGSNILAAARAGGAMSERRHDGPCRVGTGVIEYREPGEEVVRDWRVAASLCCDTPDTLRAHFDRHLAPAGCTFVAARLEPDPVEAS